MLGLRVAETSDGEVIAIETYEHCYRYCPPSKGHQPRTTFENPLPHLAQFHYPHPMAVQAIYHPGHPSVAVYYLAVVREGGSTSTGTNARVSVRDREWVLGCLKRIDRGGTRARCEVDVDGSWARWMFDAYGSETEMILGPLCGQRPIKAWWYRRR